VEAARDSLERFYHELGYPTVLVNIPEQTVSDGIVKFQVIESKIKRVWVEGNKYFTMAHIKKKLPSVVPGKILYLPDVRKDLARVNQTPDLKVSPLLIPGKELGTINVGLKVEDSLPLHGSLELNNRTTHDTTDLRLNGSFRYDNLWQKGHSIGVQFQVSPQDANEVKMASASYTMTTPWNQDHLLLGYFIWSDSETASGDGFDVIGDGMIAGFRYMMSLPGQGRYSHNISLGTDWKDFNEEVEGDTTPIAYMPFTVAYSASLGDTAGRTDFSAGLNFLFREWFVNDTGEFENKRYGSTGNYIYLTAGVERRQKLPKNFSLFARFDGQASGQPLISNEQYNAGGVNSVRGYMESEMPGDNAVHGTLELFSPSLFKALPMLPYCFYDFAWLDRKQPLEGEYSDAFIHGTGIGIQGAWKKMIEYKLDLGVALKDTEETQTGDAMVYFKVKWKF
jgi:hemolysin activation/secretion protein